MKTSTLYKTPHFNPFFFDGCQISVISFTLEGNEIVRTSCGWFVGTSSNNEFNSLNFPFEIKKARRGTSPKGAYIIIEEKTRYETLYKLVLPLELLDMYTIEENKKGWSNKFETWYFNELSFPAMGEKFEFVKDEHGEMKRKNTGLKWHTLKCRFNGRAQRSELGEKYDGIKEAAKKAGFNWSDREIAALSDVFNLSIK